MHPLRQRGLYSCGRGHLRLAEGASCVINEKEPEIKALDLVEMGMGPSASVTSASQSPNRRGVAVRDCCDVSERFAFPAVWR